jgi:hypothetical protein
MVDNNNFIMLKYDFNVFYQLITTNNWYDCKNVAC